MRIDDSQLSIPNDGGLSKAAWQEILIELYRARRSGKGVFFRHMAAEAVAVALTAVAFLFRAHLGGRDIFASKQPSSGKILALGMKHGHSSKLKFANLTSQLASTDKPIPFPQHRLSFIGASTISALAEAESGFFRSKANGVGAIEVSRPEESDKQSRISGMTTWAECEQCSCAQGGGAHVV
ncbi:uncharacterized protein MYCFIDRAFT_172860 [Pseudocercospora fijiensis CIRAD86]|uniref:Uncharacterized protein n=1 Tax=Pseudocercospora fijiensis (strain CIRAD86) TaxID=383855 RepID=M3B333_PSEFD|nr:uncharacterized protein MYCFIDRAFT_172860 [Pseudocercospora fijiensis CIRAD86]EME83783.1 hypothetical protein MYCFIDRAFT_172860 [Pseudocercospora fijiensis CIRAD86]